MVIYTSYFAKVKALNKKGIETIGIAVSPPQFYYGQHYKELAPRFNMLRMSNERYDVEFKKMLSRLDPKTVVEDLKKLSKGKDIALLCFEKDPLECHRSMVATWLERNLGIEVKEFVGDIDQKPKKPTITQFRLF
jgi:uncharacterized protein YeaO (DUF488 family)